MDWPVLIFAFRWNLVNCHAFSVARFVEEAECPSDGSPSLRTRLREDSLVSLVSSISSISSISSVSSTVGTGSLVTKAIGRSAAIAVDKPPSTTSVAGVPGCGWVLLVVLFLSMIILFVSGKECGMWQGIFQFLSALIGFLNVFFLNKMSSFHWKFEVSRGNSFLNVKYEEKI